MRLVAPLVLPVPYCHVLRSRWRQGSDADHQQPAPARFRRPSATMFVWRRSAHCNEPERFLASGFRSPSLALGFKLGERPSRSWLFRPACRHQSESARAGLEKFLQIIFPLE